MLYAALAIVKLTTLIQPATAGNQSNQHGNVTDLCWSLLAQQLPNQRMSPQNPVSLSDAEHAREGQVTPAMVDVLIPVMQQAVRNSYTQFSRACDLIVALVSTSKPALTAMIVSKVVAAGTDGKPHIVGLPECA